MKNNLKKYLSNNNVQESILFMTGAVILLVYALQNHYSVNVEWKMSPYLFPVLISVFLIFLSISLFCDGLHQIREDKSEKMSKNKWFSALVIVVAAVLYYVLLPIITFIPATILFLVAMFLFLGERKWWLIAVLSITTAVAIYFIFGTLLHVMLP